MQLLRETREWEVGIGMKKKLEVLYLDSNDLITTPPQWEKLTGLKRLRMDRNKVSTTMVVVVVVVRGGVLW